MSEYENPIGLSILVIDDDPAILRSVKNYLEARGHRVRTAETGEEGLAAQAREAADIVITDVKIPGMDGFGVLGEVRRQWPDTEVIMITAYGEVEIAVRAMREGAFDFFPKPFEVQNLSAALQRTVRFQMLRREKDRYRKRLEQAASMGRRRYGLSAIMGESKSIRDVRMLIEEVCRSDSISVLVQGETGTGKELVAQAIHYESARAAGPFVAVDCSATPEALVESAFYGHVKGAFTDAREDRKGYFEQADGGTLFLDEVGDMAPPVQAKLLRALEERRVRPVGGATEIPVDVRVISATNRDLPGAVAAGRFREDLYYRLNVFAVRVPPLRERREDVLVLANHFLNGYARELHKPLRGFSPEAAVLLAAHPFPGNVRELRNLVERAAILCEEGEVGVGDLRFDPVPHSEPSFGPPLEHVGALGKFLRSAENLDLAEAEAEMVREALRRCGGNQVLSAGMLGISRNALRRRMERYRIGNVEYRMGG